jgi:hypothetical protein
MKEKRRSLRIPTNWQVTYRVFSHGRFSAETFCQRVLNIGGGGIAFVATTEIETGTIIALVLDSTPFQSPIMALAKAVWCEPRSETYAVGAELLWIGWYNDGAQQAIANYVNSVILK